LRSLVVRQARVQISARNPLEFLSAYDLAAAVKI
jgi:hypothetical protein